jgi:hypothetical protein
MQETAERLFQENDPEGVPFQHKVLESDLDEHEPEDTAFGQPLVFSSPNVGERHFLRPLTFAVRLPLNAR